MRLVLDGVSSLWIYVVVLSIFLRMNNDISQMMLVGSIVITILSPVILERTETIDHLGWSVLEKEVSKVGGNERIGEYRNCCEKVRLVEKCIVT